jgi:hypothetical protein
VQRALGREREANGRCAGRATPGADDNLDVLISIPSKIHRDTTQTHARVVVCIPCPLFTSFAQNKLLAEACRALPSLSIDPPSRARNIIRRYSTNTRKTAITASTAHRPFAIRSAQPGSSELLYKASENSNPILISLLVSYHVE